MIRDDLVDFKLWELFRVKYADSFYGQENEWTSYLVSIGCGRGTIKMSGSISCPDSYHRVYTPHFVHIPDELAFKFLVLGLP
jgi:hypothetical protein